MSNSRTAPLYTPEILGLAIELANYPIVPSHSHFAEVHSRICGSKLAISLQVSDDGLIGAIGLNVTACAIGQAAAAIFAGHIAGHETGGHETGLDSSTLPETAEAIRNWLAGQADMPDWPRLAMLDNARNHSGRHGAILLPWVGASEALFIAQSSS